MFVTFSSKAAVDPRLVKRFINPGQASHKQGMNCCSESTPIAPASPFVGAAFGSTHSVIMQVMASECLHIAVNIAPIMVARASNPAVASLAFSPAGGLICMPARHQVRHHEQQARALGHTFLVHPHLKAPRFLCHLSHGPLKGLDSG
mmetsp:Transcript_29603/g.69793  ORF Transcript_29603/g.69793 Transcript_29603/m.69793 type:complete len:147 (+) Transcript_29603:67-507(+)